jgi:hypothetical protein
MSSQSQSRFFPRSAVVQELEERLTTPGKNPQVAANYQQLCRDPAVVLAVRYLALSAISNKLNLYSERGTANSLIQEISGHVNAVDPHKLLASIQHIQGYYPSLYRMNTLAFDTAANTAVDCIHRVAPQHPAVAAPVTDFAQPPATAWSKSPPSMDFTQPLVTVNNPAPMANDSKAIVLGGTMVATAILAGTFLLMSRSSGPSTTTAVASPTNTPTTIASGTIPSSPLATPSVTQTVLPSYSANSVQPPRLAGNSLAQSNDQTPKTVVIPLPIPTSTNDATNATAITNGNSTTNRTGDRANNGSPRTLNTAPSANTNISTAANRPSTIGFINNYYSKLKNGQPQSAWQDLTPSLQGDRQANPGGYDGEYAKWWSGPGRRTQIGKIETVKTTANAAVVQAHCRYDGKSYITEYYLAFDQASQSWKIDRIKKVS